MIPFVITVYCLLSFLMLFALIEVKLDEHHSISLLKLVVLKLIGAKGIIYPS